MKIIEPSFSITTPFGALTPELGVSMLRFIEAQARISHRSEDKQTDTSWQRFLEEVVIKHGDWSVAEHSSFTVIFRVDRGIMFELRTHRHFSFTAESTRFVKYGGKQVPELEFIRPQEIPGPEVISDRRWFAFNEALTVAEREYFYLLEHGARPQEARSVLPNALASTVAMTGNLRAWRWFFQSRITREAHPDMKAVTVPLLEEVKTKIPLLYDDLEIGQKQSISMARVH
jgi:thymidylate synthase (FAD)